MDHGPGTRRGLVQGTDEYGGTERRGQIHALPVNMKYQGLVDPEDKPFGNVLRFEVQVKIMFWVECFVTMNKRKKVLKEFKGLPKCDVTVFPQQLGQDRWWNQMVVRLHEPRKNGCHHCHRIFDHKLSVSEDMLFWEGLNHMLRFVFMFTDRYDGGIDSSAPEPGQPHEREDCVCH